MVVDDEVAPIVCGLDAAMSPAVTAADCLRKACRKGVARRDLQIWEESLEAWRMACGRGDWWRMGVKKRRESVGAAVLSKRCNELLHAMVLILGVRKVMSRRSPGIQVMAIPIGV